MYLGMFAQENEGERAERCNQMDIAHFYDVLFFPFFFIGEGLIGLVRLTVRLRQTLR